MGYYIETPGFNRNKTQIIIEKYNGKIIQRPKSFDSVPADKAIICVVDNLIFEAVGYCYNPSEFKAFSDPTDTRKKIWILINKTLAEKLTGRNSQ